MKFVKPELIEQNKGDRSKLKTRIQIPEATGASITKEVLLKEDGSTELIRRAETNRDYFATFDFLNIPRLKEEL